MMAEWVLSSAFVRKSLRANVTAHYEAEHLKAKEAPERSQVVLSGNPHDKMLLLSDVLGQTSKLNKSDSYGGGDCAK